MSEFRRRMRRRLLAMGAFGAPAAAPAERHYLPFVPASSDYAYADGGATGVKDTLGWTVIAKVVGRSASSGRSLYQVYDALSGNARLIDVLYTTPGSNYDSAGWTAAGALAHFKQITEGTATGVQVLATAHRDATTRRTDVYACKAGATLQKVGGAFGGDARTPLHVGVGAYIDASGGTHLGVALSYEAVNLIALVLLRDLASEAELQAYSLASDARDVWPSAQIWGYWPASSAVAGSIPNLGSGTAVPLTLSGPVAGDLVALQEPVTSYYSSPGGAGDYAEASSNVAARVVFPGGSMGTFSAGGWFRQPDANGVSFMVVGTVADDGISVYASGRAEQDIDVIDAGSLDQFGFVAPPDDDTWVRFVLVKTGAAEITPYLSGVAQTPISGLTGTYATAQDVFKLLRDGTGIGDCRNIIINDRAHTAGEEAALYAAGPTHHPLMPAGVWAGGQSIPVIWCTPAVGGVVANSGDGGTCGLTLAGAVTSEAD